MDVSGKTEKIEVRVVKLSEYGFSALSRKPVPLNVWGEACIELGKKEKSTVKVMAVRTHPNSNDGVYGFKLAEPDLAWRKFVHAMESGITHEDLENATRFLTT